MTQREKEQKIKEIAGNIATQFQPDKIILFGSYAWGEPDENSDVDFAIIKETDNTRLFASKIDGSIFPRPFPIDILVFHPDQIRQEIANSFIKDVISRGKVLYEKQ